MPLIDKTQTSKQAQLASSALRPPTNHAFLLEPHPVRIRLLYYSRAGCQRPGSRLGTLLPSRRDQCLRAAEERAGVSESRFQCPQTFVPYEAKKKKHI